MPPESDEERAEEIVGIALAILGHERRRKREPGVVLVDVELPDVDASEVGRKLRSRARRRRAR